MRQLFGFDDDGSARSLYFNRVWIIGAAIFLVIGAALGDRATVLIGALVLATAAATSQWNRLSLARLEITTTVSESRRFPGDETLATLEIFNNKPLPLPWLTIDIDVSEGLQPTERTTLPSGIAGRRVLQIQTHLGPYERVRWQIPMRCIARGLHSIGPITARSGDPLGFFANRLEFDVIQEITIYPHLLAEHALYLPPKHFIGDVRVPRHLFQDPLRVVGVRDYRMDDPMKTIHWKASARQGTLQVRVAEPTTTLQLSIFANLDTFSHYWEGLDVVASERVIEVAASIAVWGIDHRYSVGLTSNGITAGSDQALRIPVGRGANQRFALLEGLARISPYSTTSFQKVLAHDLGKLAAGSTVVFITSMLPDGIEMRFRSLLAAGHRVVLVPIAGCPEPRLHGLIVRRFFEEIDEAETIAPELTRARA